MAEGEGRLAALQADVQAKVSVMMTHLDGLARREARHAQRRGEGLDNQELSGFMLKIVPKPVAAPMDILLVLRV